MGNLRKVFVGLMILGTGVFALESCEVESDPEPLAALVDVSIQDIKTETGVKYGIVVYSTANYEIKSAIVTGPGTGGKVYQLTASENKQQFNFIPQSTDYTTELPAKGDYVFEIISTDDQKITGIDVVGDQKLAPIVIKTATMTNHLLKTTWDKISGVDSYLVRCYSANKAELLYSSGLLGDKAEYEFGASTSGWDSGKSPVAGTDYVVELLAIKTETGVTVDKWNNLQFISLDSKTIKWE